MQNYAICNILKNVGNQTSFLVAIHFNSIKKILWKSVGTGNCLITNSLINIFFVFSRKKGSHEGLEQLEDNRMQILFYFLFLVKPSL